MSGLYQWSTGGRQRCVKKALAVRSGYETGYYSGSNDRFARILQEYAVTLLDIIPSLRGAATSRLDPAVWPATTHYRHGRVTVGGVVLHELANQFESPTYVLDEASLCSRRATVSRGFGDAEVRYRPGPFLTSRVGGWVAHQHLSLVVDSVSELAIARRSGFAPDRIVLVVDSRGYASLPAPGHVGRIVVDATAPLESVTAAQSPQKTVVRVHPSRCAEDTIARVVNLRGLDLVGVHCDTAPTGDDVRNQLSNAVAVMCDAYRNHGVLSSELHIAIASGGGAAARMISVFGAWRILRGEQIGGGDRGRDELLHGCYK